MAFVGKDELEDIGTEGYKNGADAAHYDIHRGLRPHKRETIEDNALDAYQHSGYPRGSYRSLCAYVRGYVDGYRYIVSESKEGE